MPTFLASFPNSRIKPRSATSNEDPVPHTVKAAGTGTGPNGTTQIAVENPNRTFLTIHNLSETNDIAYGFDPAALAAGTKKKTIKKTQALDDESKDAVYAIGIGADCAVETLEGQG